MTTATRTTKAGRIERTIRVSESNDFGCRTIYATVLEVLCRGNKRTPKCDVYTLTRIPSQLGGVGVRVSKEGSTGRGEAYNVLLNAPGLGSTCECPHGSYRGHVKACRHIEVALEALRGRLL